MERVPRSPHPLAGDHAVDERFGERRDVARADRVLAEPQLVHDLRSRPLLGQRHKTLLRLVPPCMYDVGHATQPMSACVPAQFNAGSLPSAKTQNAVRVRERIETRRYAKHPREIVRLKRHQHRSFALHVFRKGRRHERNGNATGRHLAGVHAQKGRKRGDTCPHSTFYTAKKSIRFHARPISRSRLFHLSEWCRPRARSAPRSGRIPAGRSPTRTARPATPCARK